MRGTRKSAILAAATTSAALAVAAVASAAPSEVIPGTYEGKRAGVKASVLVEEGGTGRLSYTVATSCGTSRGRLSLDATPAGALKGRRSAKRATVVARITPRESGGLAGSVRVKGTRTTAGEESKCGGKRSFEATLDASSSPQVAALSGHYAGSGEVGSLPVSFDVAYDERSGGLAISNFGFETDMECWEDLDGDGEDDTLVGRISGLEGEVAADGSFTIDYYTPDDESNFYADGFIEDGLATMEIEVSGYFAPDGTPQPGGLECDSWGETYTATR